VPPFYLCAAISSGPRVNIQTGTFVEQVNKEDTLAAADRPWFEAHVRLLARPAFQFSLMLTQNPLSPKRSCRRP